MEHHAKRYDFSTSAANAPRHAGSSSPCPPAPSATTINTTSIPSIIVILGNYILDSLRILCLFLMRGQGFARCPRARFRPSNFSQMFPDQETARVYLESRLWPDGPRCPVCGLGERITARKDGFYRCNQCKEDFTVRTGTIFERSHVPLHKWIYAMYLLVTARKGISSMQLAKEIGITQKSAWFVLAPSSRGVRSTTWRSCKASSKSTRPISAARKRTSTISRSSRPGAARLARRDCLGMRERGGWTHAMPVKRNR